ncbi:MAG: leucine-rich repeat domain-containing protein [Lachnospiraceae bacterium]|nr:leucine-rich repeat domain-containing protein [Lachnospiraceae bacterium]
MRCVDKTVILPAVGETVVDDTGATYKVTLSNITKGTVTFIAPKQGAKGTIKIPNTVDLNGVTYKVTSIAKNAFKGKTSVTKVTMGSNIVTIGANAFHGCKNLKSVTIGKGVTTIGGNAFYKCTKLTKITIPSKVKKIEKKAFYGCKSLKTITVNTMKLKKNSLGSKAFTGVNKKAKIKVPKSKVKVYKKLFTTKVGFKKTMTITKK